jgi:hypothetical protein
MTIFLAVECGSSTLLVVRPTTGNDPETIPSSILNRLSLEMQ